jgi:osmotically-inducible protein OsmY
MEETFEWPDSAPQAIDEGLSGTLSEAEQLATSIERAVRRETSGGVRQLSVEVHPGGVMLKGHCDTFYCKQLAQHAAMAVPGGDRLTNDIKVR